MRNSHFSRVMSDTENFAGSVSHALRLTAYSAYTSTAITLCPGPSKRAKAAEEIYKRRLKRSTARSDAE